MVVGCWLLVVGSSSVAVGAVQCYLLVDSCWLLVVATVGHWWFLVSDPLLLWLLVVGCWLLGVRRLLGVGCWLLVVARCIFFFWG